MSLVGATRRGTRTFTRLKYRFYVGVEESYL